MSAATDKAIVAALSAITARLDAIESGTGDASPKGKAEKVQPKVESLPTLSCWTMSNPRVTDNGDGTLSYITKTGDARQYRVLSEADAIKLVKAHVKAGRRFAVPVK